MLWLCLHFPWLPLEIFTRALPDNGHGRAIAVVEKGAILCRNEPAAEQGVDTALSTGTALVLAPALLLLERQPAQEAVALHNMADWAYRFTPELALLPPHGLLLEIGASLKLFGGLAPLLLAAETQLAERGHRHQAGIAPTPAGAFLLARALPCTHATLPGDLDPAAYRRTLAGLPLAWLDGTEQQRRQLRQSGFSRIGELLSLPRAALGQRFGREFLRRLEQLTGERPDPQRRHQPRDAFHAEQCFPEPVADAAMLLFPMRRMLRELDQFLERRQSHCQRLDWQLHDQNGKDRRMDIPCSLQHNNPAALFDLTRLHLQALRLDDAVTSVALDCRHYAQVRQQTATLFAGEDHHDPEAERLLLDKLAVRLGRDGVRGIRTHDAHPPEQAWRAIDGTVPTAEPPVAAIAPATRPTWLLPQPEPIGRERQRLSWNGHLQVLRGPERIDGDWWSGAGTRDYFVARHDNGALCWIFHEHASGQWFLHGLFG